jgi:hypothetical protein
MRDDWGLLIRAYVSVLMALISGVRVVERAHRVSCAVAFVRQHNCVFHGMRARALNDDLHVTSQFASPSSILGHRADDSKPTGDSRHKPAAYSRLRTIKAGRQIDYSSSRLLTTVMGDTGLEPVTSALSRRLRVGMSG